MAFFATLDRGNPVRVPYCEAEKRAPEVVRGEVPRRSVICRCGAGPSFYSRRRRSGLD